MIKKGSLILKSFLSKNRMFPVDIHMGEFKCLNARVNNESWLWHLNFHSLENLSKRNLVNGLPHIHHPDQLCEACIFWKNHRIPFVKESWHAKFPLELVHTDVCGPMNISSVGGNKYFLTFIDIFQGKPGFMYWKARMRYSTALKYLKHLLKERVANKLRWCMVMEEVSTSLMNSRGTVKN